MRWLPFYILAYLFVAVQFALGGALRWGAWTPNIVLLFLLFIGMHAPVEQALMAGFMLGLMHDVIASHGIGTYALSYAIIGAIAVQLRAVMYSDHLVTHVAMPLLLGTGLLVYLLVRQWLRNFYFAPVADVGFRSGMMSVLITSVLAVPVIGLLRKFRRPFSFDHRQ